MNPILLTPWLELDMIIRLLTAVVLGGIIGYERQAEKKPAGLRTTALVCVGATLFTILSIYAFSPGSEPSRVAAGVVIGIGFIGAGTILRRSGSVVGLTTAATIWVVAAIGLSIGAGYYLVGFFTAVMAFIILRLPW